MSRETIDAKASRYLIQARVIVRQLDDHAGTVLADVRGNGAVYCCGRDEHGRWFCDCLARGRCAHIEAVKRVTALEPREAT